MRHHETDSTEYLAASLVWNGKLGSMLYFFLMFNKTLQVNCNKQLSAIHDIN